MSNLGKKLFVAQASLEEQQQIRRIMNHAHKGLAYTKILGYCDKSMIGNNAYRLCCDAVFNDMFAKLCILLDVNSQAHSFWKIYSKYSHEIVDILVSKGERHKQLISLRDRIKPIRDKSHFHLDLESAADWRKLWRDAKVNYNEATQAFEIVYIASRALLERSGHSDLDLPEYDGHDFARLMARACDEQILPYHWPDRWRIK